MPAEMLLPAAIVYAVPEAVMGNHATFPEPVVPWPLAT